MDKKRLTTDTDAPVAEVVSSENFTGVGVEETPKTTESFTGVVNEFPKENTVENDPDFVPSKPMIQRKVPVSTPLPETQTREVDFGNMTDAAVIYTLATNPHVPRDQNINGFTAEEWLFARSLRMTPQKLEQYSGKKVSELLAERKK
jgi:hypothetical protein